MDTNAINLERIRFGIEVALSNELPAVSESIEAVEGHLIDNVVYSFRAAIWGQQKNIEIRYPRDWWQAFKARWLPEFAKKRWPVVYTVHSISAQRLLPDFVPAPQLGRSILRMENRIHDEKWADSVPPELE